MSRTLIKRSDKVSFLGCMDGSTETFNRMRGFTALSGSKNSLEYTRHYVDEEFETTDVVGFSPSYAFAFDQYTDDEVHSEMVEILDGEYTGTEARRNIVVVDFSQPTTGGYKATKREYAIIGDAEGDSTDAYTYSGTFKATGKRITGVASVTSNGSVATFTPDSEVSL